MELPLADVARPKIVILTRHYPPAVSGGSRRPWLIARALRQHGARVQVVAPDADPVWPDIAVSHGCRDPSEAPPAREDLRAWTRRWLALPDPDVRWALRVYRTALRRVEVRPDWVLSTSPPESLHLAAALLSRRWGARLALDFRDAWFLDALRPERCAPWRGALETAMARALLRRSDLALAATAPIADELRDLGAPRTRLLRQPARDPAAPAELPRDRINAVYTGSFTMSDRRRRIEPLLRVFEAASARSPRLLLHLVGRLAHHEKDAVRASPARRAIVVHGVVPLTRAWALQSAADGLVACVAEGSSAPSSKLADYRRVGAPIIAVGEGPWRAISGLPPSGDPATDLASLTKRVASGDVGSSPDPDVGAELLAFLREAATVQRAAAWALAPTATPRRNGASRRGRV